MRKSVVILACLLAAVALAFVGRDTPTSREYCRFRFGLGEPTEVIVARSATHLLVFRDGDASSVPERYDFAEGSLAKNALIPEFSDQSGTRYRITSVSEYSDEGPPPRHALMAHVVVDEGDATSFRQYCDVALSRSVADADYCHFNGPMEIGPIAKYNLIAPKTKLVRGSSPSDIKAIVGTFDEDGGCWTVLESGNGKYPDGVFPKLTVDYTVEDSSTLSQSYHLDQFCCGAVFFGPVQVPDDALDGTATMTFQFDAWGVRSVKRTTITAPITESQAEDESAEQTDAAESE